MHYQVAQKANTLMSLKHFVTKMFGKELFGKYCAAEKGAFFIADVERGNEKVIFFISEPRRAI
jgi:hypothetical protein